MRVLRVTEHILIILIIMTVTAVSPVFLPASMSGSTAYAEETQSSFDYKYYEDDTEYRDALSKKMKSVYKAFSTV